MAEPNRTQKFLRLLAAANEAPVMGLPLGLDALANSRQGRDFRRSLQAGVAAEWLGADDQGRPQLGRRPGIVDDTLSVPTIVEPFGGTAPAWATAASERQNALESGIFEAMGVGDPDSPAEHFGFAGGKMLGQIPTGALSWGRTAGREGLRAITALARRPGAREATIALQRRLRAATEALTKSLPKVAKAAEQTAQKAAKAAEKAKPAARATGKGTSLALEFFTPTVDPKAINYLVGTGVGGGLGVGFDAYSRYQAANAPADTTEPSFDDLRAMHQEDLQMNPEQEIQLMHRRYAKGGRVARVSPVEAINQALEHLGTGNMEAAHKALASSPEALNHPVVADVFASLKPSTKRMAAGGPVEGEEMPAAPMPGADAGAALPPPEALPAAAGADPAAEAEMATQQVLLALQAAAQEVGFASEIQGNTLVLGPPGSAEPVGIGEEDEGAEGPEGPEMMGE